MKIYCIAAMTACGTFRAINQLEIWSAHSGEADSLLRSRARPMLTTSDTSALVTSKFRGANAVKFLAARLLLSFFLVTGGVAVAQSQNGPPAWAYPVNPP